MNALAIAVIAAFAGFIISIGAYVNGGSEGKWWSGTAISLAMLAVATGAALAVQWAVKTLTGEA